MIKHKEWKKERQKDVLKVFSEFKIAYETKQDILSYIVVLSLRTAKWGMSELGVSYIYQSISPHDWSKKGAEWL